MCLWKGQMSFWVYTIWKWAVFAWDILIQSTLSRLISLRSVIEHLHQVLWCTYNTVDQCFSNLVPRDPGVPRRRVRSSAKCWWKLGNFYVVVVVTMSRRFKLSESSTVNMRLYLKMAYCIFKGNSSERKRCVSSPFEPFWGVLSQEE
jgi:hypothetical protein